MEEYFANIGIPLDVLLLCCFKVVVFLQFDMFSGFLVSVSQPTVYSGEVSWGRVSGCGSWCK